METLQWTLLVGLLGMVVFVLWSRLKASYAHGVAPRVDVDWEGEAVGLGEGTVEVSVQVKTAGEVNIELRGPGEERLVVHTGPLSEGVHTWSLSRPDAQGDWTAHLTCEGHRSERRFRL
ncbi:MAG: hypothetical protein ACPGYS_03110 [Flavobacteriales bacterium]